MKLFYSPGACSLAPHIVLHESGLAFEGVLASTKTHQLADGSDYYAINPLGYVPFLVLADGRTLREGQVISQYIADQVPASGLAPAAGTWERYKLQEMCIRDSPSTWGWWTRSSGWMCSTCRTTSFCRIPTVE